MSVVLVTGASGFVGSHLVAALNRQGVCPRALLRPTSVTAALDGYDFLPVLGDVLDPASLGTVLAGCEVVYHCAGVADYWRSGRQRMEQVNVEGTRNVLVAAQAAGVRRVVLTSSLAAMGLPRRGALLTEDDTYSASPDIFPYGYSKWQAEQVAQTFVAQGLDVVIVNPGVILGPRDIHLISASLIVGAARFPFLVAPPGGACVVGVQDVARGHVLAAKRGRSGRRYILGSENISHADMFRLINQRLGRHRPLLPLPRRALGTLAGLAEIGHRMGLFPAPGETIRLGAYDFYADTTRAHIELGLEPVPLTPVVDETIAWLRAAGHLPAARTNREN